MPAGYQILEAMRINRIMQALQDVRNLPQELKFLARTPAVPATDGEILARYINRIQIADIVADDERAVTYSSGKMKFETYNIPNLKHGRALTQEEINMLNSIQQLGGLPSNDDGIFSNFENTIIDGLLLGIRQRMEALIIAMQIDTLTYDRLGIKNTGTPITWGMPSDLNVTPSVTWDTAATATPVSDVLTLKRLAQVRYGIQYNRITMSLAAFIYMVATTEFQTKSRMFLAPNVSFVNLPTQNTQYMRTLAQNVLEVEELELYDARYWSQDSTGAIASAPFLPITKVILSDSRSDNNPQIMDWASAIVTESIVSSMMRSSMVGRLGGIQRGPIAYATAPPDLNPPNITYWGVARGFPRKHLLQATAVLTVGAFSDPISVVDPF